MTSRVPLLLTVALAAVALAAPPTRPGAPMKYVKPPAEELEQRLTPEQYRVTQRGGTEPPFHNAYWDQHAPGLYVDVATGEPLFASVDKFDSGSGWPSFTRPVQGTEVVEKRDATLGMTRVEVRSRAGDSHLGHLFDDGPKDKGGRRYCINSASLRFVPVERLEAEGYGAFQKLFGATGIETAYLAGGCFWGMEEIIRAIPGVISTEVGYTGGTLEHPAYEDVHDGRGGHAEAVKVVFDAKKLSYQALLGWFFRMHDPTSKDRQGNDVGASYRSAIFFVDEAQQQAALQVKQQVDASGKWKKPLVTELAKAGAWWPAEEYHQRYLVKHPGGYTCHYLRD